MARYAKTDIRVWDDEKVAALTPIPPCGQGLWIHLLVSRHRSPIPGLLCVGEAALAEEYGWPLEGFREAFREVFEKGLAKADWRARVIWLPNAMHYNRPENPNVVRSWRVPWDETPECDLKTEAHRALSAFLKGFSEPFQEAFREACGKPTSKGLANQEQEQDPDQEPEPEPDPDKRPSRPGPQPQPALFVEAAQPPSPPVLVYPCVGIGRTWDLTLEMVKTWGGLFPSVDIMAECRAALAWVSATPAKRKTTSGMPRFLVEWFTRTQNRGGNHGMTTRPRGGIPDGWKP